MSGGHWRHVPSADNSTDCAPRGLMLSMSSRPLPSTLLHRSLVRRFLGEDAVHYGDEQQPHRTMMLRGHLEKRSTSRQPGADLAPSLTTTEHGVFHVVQRPGTVRGPGHPRQIVAEHTVPSERLRRG